MRTNLKTILVYYYYCVRVCACVHACRLGAMHGPSVRGQWSEESVLGRRELLLDIVPFFRFVGEGEGGSHVYKKKPKQRSQTEDKRKYN